MKNNATVAPTVTPTPASYTATLPTAGNVRLPPAMQAYILPQTGFIRLPQVLELYPVSKSTLWLRVKEGRFPAPVKLSERVTAWDIKTVLAFLEQQAGV